MAAFMGAHETMEVHEILTSTIDGINLLQLYRPFTKDPQLLQILDKQLQFTINEYNQAVQSLNQQGMDQVVPYRAIKNVAPVYGLDHPAAQSPNHSLNQMDDRDVASGILGFHKNSASKKMMASLECANPQLRRMMQQGSINCSEQAYEVWQYMNQAGYYQVPTMKDTTTQTVLNSYQPANYMANQTSMYQPQPNMLSQMNMTQ